MLYIYNNPDSVLDGEAVSLLRIECAEGDFKGTCPCRVDTCQSLYIRVESGRYAGETLYTSRRRLIS